MISFDEFGKIELKTAEIVDVKDHPNANKLFVLTIDVDGEKKQIVAGIKGQYSKEELLNKNIVVVNNLAPAVIRGEESNGMLLAAKDADVLSLIVPEKKVKSGSSIK